MNYDGGRPEPAETEKMPPELADLHPYPDITGGRGEVDDNNPNPSRWTKLSNALAERMDHAMIVLDQYTEENMTFDKVQLTEQEEVMVLAMKGTSEWEEDVRTYGRERVSAMRKTLAKGLVKYPEVTRWVTEGLRPQQGESGGGTPLLG